MVDIRQTIQYANYLKQIGWMVERTAEANYFIKKLPLVGSIVKIQRPDEIRINKIREITKKYRVFQIIIEPKTDLDAKYLLSIGFRLSKSPYLPTKTLQLDLTQTEKKLLGLLRKDTRRAVRQNENIATGFASPEDFRNAWKRSVGLKRYVPPLAHLKALKKSFKKNSLFIMTADGSSGAIFLLADGIAYYWQAFANKEGRKKLYQYKVVWEGILWAKKKGARIFDFEGIYDERFPNKTWLGFTHFKKSFGGYEVEYSGAFVKSRIALL
ncbi:peptidoglycan bridge formation glycyltransferase FemA/FemB family protein [Patescibacteria group bacterium]|nr:peptidoglycan bridge formation glycyltransferase FemA/FemB family protein [Patescibacteria group bacterium]